MHAHGARPRLTAQPIIITFGERQWGCGVGRRGKQFKNVFFFVYFFGGLECVGYSFAYYAHFVFLGDVWIRTQGAAVASRCATNLPSHACI